MPDSAQPSDTDSPPSPATTTATLTIAEPKTHVAHGVAFSLTNRNPERGIAVSAFELYGDVGRMRIFCMRTPQRVPGCVNLFTAEGQKIWDWRNYSEVYDSGADLVQLSRTIPTRVVLTHMIPLAPSETRIIYLYMYSHGPGEIRPRHEPEHGICYRRFKRRHVACAGDAHLGCFMQHGNLGRMMERVRFDGGLTNLNLLVRAHTVPAGRVQYAIFADATAFERVVERFAGLYLTLAAFNDADDEEVGIGSTNRHLIGEWNGTAQAPAMAPLALPGERRRSARGVLRRRSSNDIDGLSGPNSIDGLILPPHWKPSVDELETLWCRSVACRELWLRYLDRSGSGGEAWLAKLRAGVGTALQCEFAPTAIAILQALRADFPTLRASLDRAATFASMPMVQRWRKLHVLFRRRPIRRAKAALDRAIHQAKAGAAAGVAGDPFGTMAAVRGVAESYLLGRLRAFHSSPEYWACLRLWSATPSAVTLGNFTLLRTFGKGAYGQVFAARKEDTMALFALKMMPFAHAASKRGRHHLRTERQMLERAAASGSPFLCSLRYAFRAGPWLVLVLPLQSGGTLQMQIDERGAPHGLAPAETRFIAAQLCLALEAIHSLGMLHRDIKPSNIIIGRRGYLMVTDFGLSGKPGSSSRSGTRGYWSPETCKRLPQGEAADWWSMGVTLWYCASGRQPFHRRMRRDAVGTPQWEPLHPSATSQTTHAEQGDGVAQAADMGAAQDAIAPVRVVGRGVGDDNDDGDDDDDHPREWRRRLSEAELLGAVTTAVAASLSMQVANGGDGRNSTAPTVEGSVALDPSAARRRRPRMTEEELNFNTLHMPIDVHASRAARVPADLGAFIHALLERDPDKRLCGDDAHGSVRSHPLFARHIEWALLERQELVAPFVPDSELVYTHDRITDFSGSLDLPSDELLDDFRDWDYGGEGVGYGDELRQLVQKSTTRQVLNSMAAPAAVLAKLDEQGAAAAEEGERRASSADGTQSEHGARSETTQSETGSHDFDNVDDHVDPEGGVVSDDEEGADDADRG